MRVLDFRLYVLVCVILLVAPVTVIALEGHDWQRMAQYALAVLAFLLLMARSLKSGPVALVSSQARVALACVLAGGVVSAGFSHQPLWSLTEVGLAICCLCIASGFAVARKEHVDTFDSGFVLVFLALCLIKCVQFLAMSLAAFTSDVPVIEASILLDGFSNQRFYGQFQTLTLPLLAFPLMLPKNALPIKAAAFCLLSCWWMIAICGGTRGTWMGMGAAAIVLSCCAAAGRLWMGWQLLTAAAGCALYWALFSLLPGYLGFEILNFAGDRLTTSLSARDIIWEQAWEMIASRPLLGYGPMHFADIPNLIAAHPHQAVLQWASEWGIPSALLVGALAAWGTVATGMLLRRKQASRESADLLRVCVFASLIGALAQSMVDGVIVMPYSQLWLSIVIGWLLSSHEWRVQPKPAGPVFAVLWLSVMGAAVLLLGYVMARDVPHLEQNQQHYARDFGGPLKPRFWVQGVIATKPQ